MQPITITPHDETEAQQRQIAALKRGSRRGGRHDR